jgi:MoxR-like ATPase
MKRMERINKLRDNLLTGLVERDVPVSLALLAALTGEHLLLVGPPGTAKSLVARRLKLAFGDVPYFERLLTRFTVPEEIFGPLSIKALEEDRYERLVDSYLPTASVAFLDEIFKANSAILNSLLTLLNEREFDNGTVRSKTPLLAVIGASNELPEEKELSALYDRFLLRLHMGPVSQNGFENLLELRGESEPEVAPELRFTVDELKTLRMESEAVALSVDVKALLRELRGFCVKQEIQVSDRRWRKIVKLLQMSAHTNGKSEVSIWDCWLLQHCLWNSPEERATIYGWYADRVGATGSQDISKLESVISAWEDQLKRDRSEKSQARDDDGALLYLDALGKRTVDNKGSVRKTRNGEKLYTAPKGARQQRDNYRYSDFSENNEGNGFTEEELDELWTSQGTRFREWSSRDDHLENHENWIFEEGSLRPSMQRTRHKRAYIDACHEQLRTVEADVEAFRAHLSESLGTLQDTIERHLWTPDDFLGPASTALETATQDAGKLTHRLKKVRDGYLELPTEEIDIPQAA